MLRSKGDKRPKVASISVPATLATARADLTQGQPPPLPAALTHGQPFPPTGLPQKYTAKGPRGPSMTSTGVSNTLDSTSPVMISSGAPNSMTAPSLTAQMWSA